MICVMQRGDRLSRVTAPAHTNLIYSITLRVVADGERERQSVFHHHRVAADISLAADAAELMHARIRADVRTVIDGDMAGQSRRISHQHVITKHAVMSNVG